MNFFYLSWIGLVLLFFSCDKNEDCCLPIIDGELLGTYRVYEYGFSPGDGYIVEEVPAQPAQLFKFFEDNQFSSNYTGLTAFNYYALFEDDQYGVILALFTEEPDFKEEFDINNLRHVYNVKFEEFNVKLHYRFCIEGCHIGLKKIE